MYTFWQKCLPPKADWAHMPMHIRGFHIDMLYKVSFCLHTYSNCGLMLYLCIPVSLDNRIWFWLEHCSDAESSMHVTEIMAILFSILSIMQLLSNRLPCPSIDFAPSLGVYYFLSLTLSVCLSVCHAAASNQFFFFCFLMESSHFWAVRYPCGTLQNIFLRFLI